MLERKDKNTELREYLLGSINLDERLTKIEEKLMTSDDYFQDFLIEEEELIQDYVNDHLTLEDRQNFEKLFLISENRRQRIKFAYVLKDYITDNELKPKKKLIESLINWLAVCFRPVLALRNYAWQTSLISLLILSIIGVIVWRGFFYSSKATEVSLLINKAYSGGRRPFEARITEFDYAPINNLRGGKSDVETDTPDSIALEEAFGIASKSARENPTAENFHNLGRVYLAKKDFDRAIEQLEKANNLGQSKNAGILSDLGISYLEKSKRLPADEEAKKLDYRAKALNTIEAAIELNPNLPEARFNRAFCLQELGATEGARQAWQEYLKLDPNSKWAEEANKYLNLLPTGKLEKTKAEMLQAFMTSFKNKDDDLAWEISSKNREMIKGKLIPQQLAFSFLNSEGEEKAGYLSALKYAGELEKRQRQDPYFSEMAAYYEKTSVDQQKLLKEAQTSMTNGFELSRKDQYEDSYNSFSQAQKLFETAGDIWEARLGEYWSAMSLHNQGNLTEHKRILDGLEDFCQKRNYRWFLVEIYVWQGVNAEELTELTKAVEYQKKAIKLSEDISEVYNLQKSQAILAEDYILLRQYQPLLETLQKALASSAQYPEISARQRWRTFNSAARGFYVLKYYAAAAAFEKEILTIGKDENDTTFDVTGNLNLGLIYSQQQKYREAIDLVNKSTEQVKFLEDAGTKNKYNAIAYTGSANFKRLLGDCDNALADYSKAIEYSSAEYKANEYEARKGRLLCYISQNNQSALQTELPEVLDLFEQNRRNVTEEESRNAFFNDEQNVYDLAVDYEYKRGNYSQAFNDAETSRSRSLLDSLTYGIKVSENEPEIKFAEIAKPLLLDQIQAQLPEKIQVVDYSVLNDKVLIWFITKDDFAVFSSPISANDLNDKVLSYLTSLKKSPAESKRLSGELYQILVTPVISKIDRSKEISFIPDKFLFQLPFSALVSPQTGKYLVEDFNTFYAPSANVLLLSTAKAEEKMLNSSPEKTLVVGNPAFDKSAFDLENLPSAEREAEVIAKIYPDSISLIGRNATKSGVKLELPKADIVHYAGHYVVDSVSPMRSFLLLAGSGDDARLSNYELMKAGLSSNTKLIILSACQTGIERYYNGEGMIGASRTFLGMGVPLVIASQWQIDSDATGILMSKFHQYRIQNKLSSSEALRQAQLDMLNGPNKDYKEPFYWAGFAPIGGYTKF